ncbi:unnamed protein product [Closterium sp. NIES-53]
MAPKRARPYYATHFNSLYIPSTVICTDASTRALLATFTKEPHSGLFVLHTTSSQVAESGQVTTFPHEAESSQVTVSLPVAVSSEVVASSQVAASCSCRSLTHPTFLWHHRLGHPLIPCLRSMASHSLVSGLPCVFSSLPPLLAPPCTPSDAGRLRATPHSSSLCPATSPFQTLHLDVWGPAPTLGPERERYILVVIDDYSRYTTVFPLAKNSEVTSMLVWCLLATQGTRGSRVSCLHSGRGGEFCSGVLAGFCGKQGITQYWTLLESPRQNGVAKRHIGLVMDIARTSVIYARAPHFLWPYTLRYAAHQLSLQPRLSWPEVSPTRLWTGSPGVGSAFRVWGCLALVRDTSADKLLACAIPCVFLGFPVGSPDYSFYHPPLHQFLDSRDVRFDESVSYYIRYPCRGLPGVSRATPLPSDVRQVASPSSQPSSQSPQKPLALPRQVTWESGGVGAGGAVTGGARSGGARSRGAGGGGTSTGGASSWGARDGDTGTRGASSGGSRAGGTGTGGASSGGAGAGGTGTGSASFGGAGEGGVGVVGAGTEETGARGSPTASPTAPPHRHDTRFQALCRLEREEQEQLEQERQELQRLDQQQQQQQPQPSLLQQLFHPVSGLRALGLPSSPPVHSQSPTTRCPPCARPSSPLADLRTILFHSPPRRSPPRRSPPVSILPSPPQSSLIVSSHPITDYYRAARPVVSLILASLVTDPRVSPSSVSALTAAVADFASTCRLDYATRVVAAPPPCPLSVEGESSLGCDVLEDRQFELKFLAVTSPSICAMLLSLEGDPDALDISTPRTYRTYVDAFPPPMANVVDGMWLFKPHSPPGFTDIFPPGTQWSLRRRVYDLRQSPREWHDTLRSTLRDIGFPDRAALAEVKSELQKRHKCTDIGELQRYLGLQITWERATRTITLTQSHMVQQVLRRFGFQFSTTQPTLLAIDHRLTGPFPDEPSESRGPYAELVGCLMYLMTCIRPDLAFLLSVLSRFVATGRHRLVHSTAAVRVAKYLATTSGMGLVLGGTQPVVLTGHCESSYADDVETQRLTQGYCFSLGAGAVSWRSTRLSSVASSSAEAEIYASAMAAQKLRWLTFLLADLGERPRSAPTLYADNKVMILLCQEP